MTAFTRAFNGGDAVRLDRMFARRPSFKWYSSGPPGERLSPEAFRRNTLIAYFLDRHGQEDTLALTSFVFVGPSTGTVHFNGTFRRSALDYRSGAPFVVGWKGAALCRRTRTPFIVMSLGGPR